MTAFVGDVKNFHPLKDHVFVTDLESGPSLTKGGIIIPDDNMKQSGIRDRWGKVWKVGPDVDDLKPGNWILIQHGRWTEGIDFEMPDGILRAWRTEYPESVLMVSDDYPLERHKTVLLRNR